MFRLTLLSLLFILASDLVMAGETPTEKELEAANRAVVELHSENFDKRANAIGSIEKLFSPHSKTRVKRWEEWLAKKLASETDPDVRESLKKLNPCKHFEFADDVSHQSFNCTAYLDDGTWVLHGVCRIDGLFSRVYPYKDGLLEGNVILRRKDTGLIYKDCNYHAGQLEGAFMQYYSNGNKELSGSYHNGKKVGEWTNYGRDGNPLGTYIMNDGNGAEILYHPNGTIAQKSLIKGGHKEGLEEQWYEDGELSRSSTYKYFAETGQSIADGPWKMRNFNGEFEYDIVFKAGFPVSGFINNVRIDGKSVNLTFRNGVVLINGKEAGDMSGQILKPWIIADDSFTTKDSRFTKVCFVASKIKDGKAVDPLTYDPQLDFRACVDRLQKREAK